LKKNGRKGKWFLPSKWQDNLKKKYFGPKRALGLINSRFPLPENPVSTS
jgi:hypothetical protein